jgi:hypothetical protein
MKAYITKYAPTKGIIEVDDAEEPKWYPGMITAKSLGFHACFHGEGKEWHRTKEGAIKRAEEMRRSKLQSIEKQMRRIEAIAFE